MYHLELRQFPHNLNRFNLEEGEVRAILYPWVAEQWIEIEERKWSAHQAKLTILEGPELPLQALTMGRGWRAAQREGRDVTAELIARVKQELAARGTAVPAPPPPAPAMSASLVGPAPPSGPPPHQPPPAPAAVPEGSLEPVLGPDASMLLAAWTRIAARAPGLTPSESLALAEREVSRPPDGR